MLSNNTTKPPVIDITPKMVIENITGLALGGGAGYATYRITAKRKTSRAVQLGATAVASVAGYFGGLFLGGTAVNIINSTGTK